MAILGAKLAVALFRIGRQAELAILNEGGGGGLGGVEEVYEGTEIVVDGAKFTLQ